MKLKNVLVLTFLTLTIIPFIIVTVLLYKSGFELSKASYTANLEESINVQTDYISQAIEASMIADYRFVNQISNQLAKDNNKLTDDNENILSLFRSYLETSEDKISVCLLLDKDNQPVYTIGEKATLDTISAKLHKNPHPLEQVLMEFELESSFYSLGTVTPLIYQDGAYGGSLITIYDTSYILKIISSYYKIVDTSTYICRSNGDTINFQISSQENKNAEIEHFLHEYPFSTEGKLNTELNNSSVSGYYKNIYNTPWYLVGFVNDDLIYSFTNQFMWIYLVIIIVLLIIAILLSFYFSQKVVRPINDLIKVMEDYQSNLNHQSLEYGKKKGYFETSYLWEKFSKLMNTISLVRHNFDGIYQLYQSSVMDDTNIDIDVKNQTISSNKETFQELMNHLDTPEGACIVERFTRCFCHKDELLLTQMFEAMRDEHLSVAREADVYTPHLNQKWFHTLVVPMYTDERLSRLFIQLRDITAFKKQEQDSIEQARKDILTGLYNRLGFSERVNQMLHPNKDAALHALLFIDMNFFKLVNDNFGHNEGDILLCSVAKTLSDIVTSSGIVCRFGGDEFVIFLPATSEEQIAVLKQTLNSALVYPYHCEKASFVVSASIGVSKWSSSSPKTLDSLLQEADAAMYETKREFKQNIH